MPVWPAVRVSPAATDWSVPAMRRQRREFLLLLWALRRVLHTAFVNCWITGDVATFRGCGVPDAARLVAEVTAPLAPASPRIALLRARRLLLTGFSAMNASATAATAIFGRVNAGAFSPLPAVKYPPSTKRFPQAFRAWQQCRIHDFSESKLTIE